MSDPTRNEKPTAQEQQDEQRLALDKETIKDLEAKSDDQVRGGRVVINTIVIIPDA